MIIDGRQIALDVEAELTDLTNNTGSRRLSVVVVGNDPASLSFTKLKKKVGERIGVSVDLKEFASDVSAVAVLESLNALANDSLVDGIIVQLPLPTHFDTEVLLNVVPPHKDIDSLASKTNFVAPVALAIEEILKRNNILLREKRILIIGQGKLVGRPVKKWFENRGHSPDIADEFTENFHDLVKNADIIVSGAGVPGLIKPDMITDGVVLIDAGSSEAEGKLVGDADPKCEIKCLLFTPVPGGVGPITVVMLFKNLLAT